MKALQELKWTALEREDRHFICCRTAAKSDQVSSNEHAGERRSVRGKGCFQHFPRKLQTCSSKTPKDVHS
jgi:hypothetical protein